MNCIRIIAIVTILLVCVLTLLFRFSTICNRDVSLDDLLRHGVVGEDLVKDVEKGKVSREQLKKDLKIHLIGIPALSGILVEETGEKLSFLEATKRKLLAPSEALTYLEAQVSFNLC